MSVLSILRQSIGRIGIKEVARRTEISASTISRINSGKIIPSIEIFEKISKAMGFSIELKQDNQKIKAPRLNDTKEILGRLRKELKSLGVRHTFVFGSVARHDDKLHSDIDIYLEFTYKPSIAKLLKAEGIIIEAFGENKVDIVSDLSSSRGQKLKLQIDKDGERVF